MKSLPTVEQSNLEHYWNVIRQLDPEWYLMRVDAEAYKVQPYIIRRVLRALFNLTTKAHGTGYGKVQIFVEEDRVSHIKPEESDRLDMEIFVEESMPEQ
jgi:hypothetical protein